jgi:hypothetical protein
MQKLSTAIGCYCFFISSVMAQHVNTSLISGKGWKDDQGNFIMRMGQVYYFLEILIIYLVKLKRVKPI